MNICLPMGSSEKFLVLLCLCMQLLLYVTVFISAHRFSHFYSSGSLSSPTGREGTRGCVMLSNQLGLSHDKKSFPFWDSFKCWQGSQVKEHTANKPLSFYPTTTQGDLYDKSRTKSNTNSCRSGLEDLGKHTRRIPASPSKITSIAEGSTVQL